MKAKDLADQLEHGAMPLSVVNEMYELRDAEVAELASKAVITVSDVLALERTGRVRVASELFAKCDADARASLLQDEHHFVRSVAMLSSLDLGMAPTTTSL